MQKMMINNKIEQFDRLRWIDICKGLCMLTVVLFHVRWKIGIPYIDEYLNNLKGLYQVLMFFCLSGVTLKEEKLSKTKSFILCKVKTIYVKILLFGLIAVMLHNYLISVDFYRVGIDYDGKQMFFWHGFDFFKQAIFTTLLANREVILGPMWFANVLFISLVGICLLQGILQLIIKDKNKSRLCRLFILMLLMILSISFTEKLGLTIRRFSNSITAAFIIDFVSYLVNYIRIDLSNKFYFLCSLLCLLFAPIYGTISLNINGCISHIYLIFITICVLYVFYNLSRMLETIIVGIVFEEIGKASFYVMALQVASFKILAKLIGDESFAVTTSMQHSVIMVACYVIVGTGIPVLIYKFVNLIKKHRHKRGG